MKLHRVLMSRYKIMGSVSNGFEPVKKLFEKNFIKKIERNAQLCVYVGGEKVVDLFGSANEASNYDGDSLTTVFSSTKNLTAIGIATLVDKGLLCYSDQVIKHWPEYGNEDRVKETMTIAEILRHEGGMPHFTKTLTLADIQKENIKKNSIGKVIEEEPLRFPREGKTEYHSLTRGFILNEIFRRVDPQHRTVGEWLLEDMSLPLKADVHIGLTYDKLSRSTDLTWGTGLYVLGQSLIPRFLGRKTDPSLLDFIKMIITVGPEMKKMGEVPPIEHIPKMLPEMITHFNIPAMKLGEIPSANGQCSARGLAKIAAMMANKGEIDGIRMLSEEAWTIFHSECQKKSMFAFKEESNFSRGGVNYFLPAGDGMLFKNNKYRIGFYGWQGMGGSLFQWDPEKNIGFSYVPTFLEWEDMSNTKGSLLQKEVVDCVETLK